MAESKSIHLCSDESNAECDQIIQLLISQQHHRLYDECDT